jgi:recombination protein RecT
MESIREVASGQAPPQTTAVATQSSLKSVISGDNFKNAVKQALPSHLSHERFIRVAITALTKTPKLRECTQESFLKCLLDLSAVGLEPDGRRAHLIPYGKECTLIIDYKGIVELVRRSGEVSYIHCDVVYEGDKFAYQYGSEASLVHIPDLEGPRAKKRAFYSFVKLKDGSEDFMVWSLSQVEAIRKRSKAKDNGPWVTDFDEMGKKSVFRNHSKWLPLSSELRDKIERDDDQIALDGSFEVMDDVVEGTRQDQKDVANEKLTNLRKPKEQESSTQTATDAKADAAAQPEATTAGQTTSEPGTAAPSAQENRAPQDELPRHYEDLRAWRETIGGASFAEILGAHGYQAINDVPISAFPPIQEALAQYAMDHGKKLPEKPPDPAPTTGRKLKFAGQK